MNAAFCAWEKTRYQPQDIDLAPVFYIFSDDCYILTIIYIYGCYKLASVGSFMPRKEG